AFVLREEVADDLLGVTPGINVGGIDEVASLLQVPRDDCFGLLNARTPAQVFSEAHAAQTKWADPQSRVTERHVGVECHRCLLCCLLCATLWRSPGSLRQSAQPVPGRL